MRFLTPHFSLDLLCDLTSPLKIAQLQDYLSGMSHVLFINNIGRIYLKETPLKTPETLKKKLAVVSLQTKQLAFVIKVVRN